MNYEKLSHEDLLNKLKSEIEEKNKIKLNFSITKDEWSEERKKMCTQIEKMSNDLTSYYQINAMIKNEMSEMTLTIESLKIINKIESEKNKKLIEIIENCNKEIGWKKIRIVKNADIIKNQLQDLRNEQINILEIIKKSNSFDLKEKIMNSMEKIEFNSNVKISNLSSKLSHSQKLLMNIILRCIDLLSLDENLKNPFAKNQILQDNKDLSEINLSELEKDINEIFNKINNEKSKLLRQIKDDLNNKNKINELKMSINSQLMALETLKLENEQKETIINEITEKNIKLENEIKDLSKRNSDLIENYKIKIQTLENYIEELRENNEEFKINNIEKDNEILILEKKNIELEDELKNLNGLYQIKIQTLNKNIDELEENIKGLRINNEEKDNKITLFEEKLNDQYKIQTLNNKIEELKKNIQELRINNTEKDNQIIFFEEEIKNLQENNSNFEEQIKTLNFEKHMYKNTFTQLKEKFIISLKNFKTFFVENKIFNENIIKNLKDNERDRNLLCDSFTKLRKNYLKNLLKIQNSISKLKYSLINIHLNKINTMISFDQIDIKKLSNYKLIKKENFSMIIDNLNLMKENYLDFQQKTTKKFDIINEKLTNFSKFFLMIFDLFRDLKKNGTESPFEKYYIKFFIELYNKDLIKPEIINNNIMKFTYKLPNDENLLTNSHLENFIKSGQLSMMRIFQMMVFIMKIMKSFMIVPKFGEGDFNKIKNAYNNYIDFLDEFNNKVKNFELKVIENEKNKESNVKICIEGFYLLNTFIKDIFDNKNKLKFISTEIIKLIEYEIEKKTNELVSEILSHQKGKENINTIDDKIQECNPNKKFFNIF